MLDSAGMSETFVCQWYKSAAITVIWIELPYSNDEPHGRRQLVYASVEFVPKYFGDVHAVTAQKARFKGIRIFFCRHSVDPQAGWQWYSRVVSCSRVPMPERDNEEIYILPQGWEELDVGVSPVFPQTSFCNDSPIVPRCWGGAQVSHVMPIPRLVTLERYLEDAGVMLWISDRLHWAFNEHLEYLGSVNLVLPNPYYCRSRARLTPATVSGSKDEVQIYFDRSIGAHLLRLIFSERIHDELSGLKIYNLEGASLKIRLGGVADESGYIVCDGGGRIWDMEPFCGFIRSIKVNFGIVTQTNEYYCRDGICQKINLHRNETMSLDSDSNNFPEVKLLNRIGAMRHAQAQKCFSRHQYFFYDQREEARRLVRSIINSARHCVWIVDPYFSSVDVGEYLSATNAPTNVLCTEREIRREIRDGMALGESLQKAIQEVPNQEIKVEIVSEETLHDRYIVIDEGEVWLLGCSLNGIGKGLSTIVRLENPLDVIRSLHKLVEQFKSKPRLLCDWVKDHK